MFNSPPQKKSIPGKGFLILVNVAFTSYPFTGKFRSTLMNQALRMRVMVFLREEFLEISKMRMNEFGRL